MFGGGLVPVSNVSVRRFTGTVLPPWLPSPPPITGLITCILISWAPYLLPIVASTYSHAWIALRGGLRQFPFLTARPAQWPELSCRRGFPVLEYPLPSPVTVADSSSHICGRPSLSCWERNTPAPLHTTPWLMGWSTGSTDS